jgi:hypothetical protein
MNTSRLLTAATLFAAFLIFASFNAAPAQAQTSAGDSSHQGQIYGTVQTGNMATSNQSRMEDLTIVVRKDKDGRLGKVVGFSDITNGQYAVNMGGLPAGKYVVMVDPGASFYKSGERLVKYPGPNGSKKQNWTVSTNQNAIPSLE